MVKRLLITIHHLVIDGVSWRILLQDLAYCYHQFVSNDEAKLSYKTTSYKEWAYQILRYSKSHELLNEIPYWEETLKYLDVYSLPIDFNIGEQLLSDDGQIIGELSIEETKALLTEVHSAYNTNINEILLTALVMTLKDWTGQDEHLIELEGHGRQELFSQLNVSRTVGWFTSIYPVKFSMKPQSDLSNGIKAVKEELRRVPNSGLGYSILRYIAKIWGEPSEDQSASVIFNYLGQFDSEIENEIFKPAKETSGTDIAPTNYRTCLLEVIGLVAEDKLQIRFSYSKNRYHDQTISKLLNNYFDNLKAIITYCIHGQNVGYTPSDFEMAGLKQDELDQIGEEMEALLGGNLNE